MKTVLIAAATTAMLATSASAFSIPFSLPSLTFAPAPDVTVTKDCIEFDAATNACITQE